MASSYLMPRGGFNRFFPRHLCIFEFNLNWTAACCGKQLSGAANALEKPKLPMQKCNTVHIMWDAIMREGMRPILAAPIINVSTEDVNPGYCYRRHKTLRRGLASCDMHKLVHPGKPEWCAAAAGAAVHV